MYQSSNLDWFKSQYDEDYWRSLVEKSRSIAAKKAKNRFAKLSDLDSAREMIEQILSTKESRAKYYNLSSDGLIEDLKKEYDLIYQSLSKPIIRLEAACFMWLVKR